MDMRPRPQLGSEPQAPPLAAPSSILLLETPSGGIEDLGGLLAASGHAVTRLSPADRSFEADLARALATPWDAILCDRDLIPVELLSQAGPPGSPAPPVLILESLGAFPTEFDGGNAVEPGVFDVLHRPVAPGEVLVAVSRALVQSSLLRENRDLKQALNGRVSFGDLRTRDRELARVMDTARTVADTRATVLIQGESGTGKTLLARAIHGASDRSQSAFIEVNCGALPDALLESELFGHARGAFTGATADKVGRFEAADGGTIFLDEIGSASLELQVRLLRVLQEHTLERLGETRTRTVDVRLICATHVDLEAAVAAGTFREDLYWRIHVVRLELPPLRERPADVGHLARFFLGRFATEYKRTAKAFDAGALAYLTAHAWPGNVRQLENVVERAVLLSTDEHIRSGDLGLEPASEVASDGSAPHFGSLAEGLEGLLSLTEIPPLREALEVPERLLIQRALELTDGSRKATAVMLGINRTTLFNKMRKYGLLERDWNRLGPPPSPSSPLDPPTPTG